MERKFTKSAEEMRSEAVALARKDFEDVLSVLDRPPPTDGAVMQVAAMLYLRHTVLVESRYEIHEAQGPMFGLVPGYPGFGGYVPPTASQDLTLDVAPHEFAPTQVPPGCIATVRGSGLPLQDGVCRVCMGFQGDAIHVASKASHLKMVPPDDPSAA